MRDYNRLRLLMLFLFVWPLIFVNIFIITGQSINKFWELAFFVISMVFGIYFSVRLLKESTTGIVQLTGGVILFSISYLFLIRVALRTLIVNSIQVLSLLGMETDEIELTTYYGQLLLTYVIPIVLVLLFVFPLFSWLVLIDVDKEDSIVLFQRYMEKALEQFTEGSNLRAILLYFIIYIGGFYLNLMYFTSILSQELNGILLSIILSFLVMALFLPILNTAFITAQGYVDSIRSRKTTKAKSLLNRIYQRYIIPSITIVLLLAVIGGLVLQILSIGKTNTNQSDDIFAYVGFLSITAKLILGGIGSLHVTAIIWENIDDDTTEYNPIQYYPVYILSALLLTISVEFLLINFEVNDLLVQANLPLVVLFILEKITILIGVVIIFRSDEGIKTADVDEIKQ